MNYDQVDTEYRLRHNDLLANIVHRYVKVDQFGTKINVKICIKYFGIMDDNSQKRCSVSCYNVQIWFGSGIKSALIERLRLFLLLS